MSGKLIRLQQCIIDDINARLELYRGSPTEAATEHRDYILSLFLGRGSRCSEKRIHTCVMLEWRLEGHTIHTVLLA